MLTQALYRHDFTNGAASARLAARLYAPMVSDKRIFRPIKSNRAEICQAAVERMV